MLKKPFIDDTIRRRIEAELEGIESEHNVRILLAVESGSRAWGFPSVDSDYDMRFIYSHTMDAYLSIESPRDVIERPIDAALDISGWDIRKALGLLVRSNAVVFEWLASPVKYKSEEALVTQMRSLSDRACFLPALAYHYDRMARRSFDEALPPTDSIALKTYFYAVRPCLALMWIRRFGVAPPMDLPALLRNDLIDREVRTTISELVGVKAEGTERTLVSRVGILDDFIRDVLSEPVVRSLQDTGPCSSHD